MEKQNDDPVRRCPSCAKCISISQGYHPIMHVCFHKEKPSSRPGSFCMSDRRRCPHCGEYFFVENHVSIGEMLRWLIFNDPDALAREQFEKDPELVKKLRQDKQFMTLINSDEFDN